MPACSSPDQTHCILSWQSFAEPTDPALIVDTFDATTGFTGKPRARTPMICTNPITGKPGDSAPAGANLGSPVPEHPAMRTQTVRREKLLKCFSPSLVLDEELNKAVLSQNRRIAR